MQKLGIPILVIIPDLSDFFPISAIPNFGNNPVNFDENEREEMCERAKSSVRWKCS